ncbi:hypothetical protein BBJ28_00008942, partial [Nothophytophthora sp. Chile5]
MAQYARQQDEASMEGEWLDSEFEESPRSNDDISSMFSNSPNAGGRKAPAVSAARPAAVSAAESVGVEDVDGDMRSFYGAGFAPTSQPGGYRLPTKSVGQARFQDVPVGLVADQGVASKRALVRRIQQDS